MPFRNPIAFAAAGLLSLVPLSPAPAADTTIQLGNGNTFAVEDEFGNTRFSVDNDGNVFPGGELYANTIIVSATGSESSNGLALENAITGITDASANNPYLVKIEPGIYNIGSGSLSMKEFVDIEGSGQGVTTIRNTGAGNPQQAGVLEAASNAEVRFLTLFSNSIFSNAAGVYADSGADLILRNVTIRTANSSSSSHGVNTLGCGQVLLEHVRVENSTNGGFSQGLNFNQCTGTVTVRDSVVTTQGGTTVNSGINLNAVSALLARVDVEAAGGSSNYGIQTEKSYLELRDVWSRADFGTNSSYGVEVDDDFTGPVTYTVTIHNSELIGNDAAITTAPETELNIASSKLDGGVVNTYNLTCAGVYDGAYVFYASSCP